MWSCRCKIRIRALRGRRVCIKEVSMITEIRGRSSSEIFPNSNNELPPNAFNHLFLFLSLTTSAIPPPICAAPDNRPYFHRHELTSFIFLSYLFKNYRHHPSYFDLNCALSISNPHPTDLELLKCIALDPLTYVIDRHVKNTSWRSPWQIHFWDDILSFMYLISPIYTVNSLHHLIAGRIGSL